MRRDVSVLLLEALETHGADRALGSVGPLLLWRDAGGVFAEVSPDAEEALTRSLAFAGVRTTRVATPPPTPPAMTAAIGLSLAQLTAPAALDMIRLRPLDLGEASARLLRRRVLRRRAGRRERDRCVAILRERDRMIGWQRRSWAAVSVLHDRRMRGVLRPPLFDRNTTPPERLVFAADGEITRWAFG